MFDTLRMTTVALTFAGALAAPLALPAMAAEPQVSVKYRDLDLSTVTGQRELEMRLDRAARSVCGLDQHVTGSHMPTRAAKTCYSETKARLSEHFAQLVENDNRRGG